MNLNLFYSGCVRRSQNREKYFFLLKAFTKRLENENKCSDNFSRFSLQLRFWHYLFAFSFYFGFYFGFHFHCILIGCSCALYAFCLFPFSWLTNSLLYCFLFSFWIVPYMHTRTRKKIHEIRMNVCSPTKQQY